MASTPSAGHDKKVRQKVKEVARKFGASFHELHGRQGTYIIGDPDLRLKLQELIRHIVCKRYATFTADVAAWDRGSRPADFFRTAGDAAPKSLMKYIEFDEAYLGTMIMQLFHI